MLIDHPIFLQSILYIKTRVTTNGRDSLEQDVLERLIHTSGDFSIESLLRFSTGACEEGIKALKAGAPILTDTRMASCAVSSMAYKTLGTKVYCSLDWIKEDDINTVPLTAQGMERAWNELSNQFSVAQSPLVIFGSAPQAMKLLIEMIRNGANPPSLIIGMPVGFIGVLESKKILKEANLPQIVLEGNRGGAAMAAATVNALLRAAVVPSN